ncbi:AmiR/NasT family two-component response regulator [Methanomicrobium sp. W14]|jgi:AmiR/NasT family two-component response regulator|uniref:PAS domain S-box protein n=1 Tax=Methanomicrobium sp. W14 TaxID=2817839 RepID=UPI001AE5F91E|nr:PAS domain S-box protein [Methanomicrobium sp. W14]MBP2134594.1 AmiR/NasT family two-component response regulator [Methanomicrobium sp. W14]
MATQKILIVNDDVSDAIVTKAILRKNNFEVSGIIIDALDAIQQAGSERPDLVLMKIGISGSASSIEAASKIIENYRVPVMFIVGDNDISLLKRIKKLNNPVVVLKPFSEAELIKSVTLAINRHIAEEKMRQSRDEANIDPAETGLNNIPAPAITINKRGAITRINKEMEFFTGFRKNELIGRKFLSLIDTTEKNSGDEDIRIWPDKVLIKLSNGKTQRVSIFTGFLESFGDNFDEQILVFKKETGEVEFAVKDIDVIFAKVLNSLDDIVFVLNTEMEITHYNQKFAIFAKRLSMSKFQLSRPVYEIPQFSKIANVNVYEELFKNAREVKQVRKYGSGKDCMYMLFKFIPLETNGKTSHMITVMRDITEMQEARQKTGVIYDEFMKNRTLIKNIHTAIGDIRTALYGIVKYVEKNPDKLRDSEFQQVAMLTRHAEKKLLVFDNAWSKYETQLNMLQMNAKYKFDKK